MKPAGLFTCLSAVAFGQQAPVIRAVEAKEIAGSVHFPNSDASDVRKAFQEAAAP